MSRVYFAHSMEIYGTREAMNAERAIRRLIPGCHILNPEDFDWEHLVKDFGSEGAFQHVVFVCDRVVALEYLGYVGRGVYCEVRAALKLGRPVHVLRDGRLKLVKRVKRTAGEWKVKYGRLLC